MGDEVLFNRYAIALLEIAIEQNKTEEFRKEVKIFATATAEKSRNNGRRSWNRLNRFVKVIIKNNRAHYLYKIFKESLYRFDDYLEIQEGKLILSKEMSEEEKEKIIKSIEKNEGVRLELEEVIDPSILGGFIVTLKDNVYDASLKTKLQNLKESLKN